MAGADRAHGRVSFEGAGWRVFTGASTVGALGLDRAEGSFNGLGRLTAHWQCGLEDWDWITQRRKGAKGPSLSETVGLTGGVRGWIFPWCEAPGIFPFWLNGIGVRE